MSKQHCRHKWAMTNIRDGFIMYESCSHCQTTRSYFSYDDIPAKEPYREGVHVWNYSDSAQSVKFDLKCMHCSEIVDLDELMGLMTCAACTDDCDLHTVVHIAESQKVWVYAALSFSQAKGREHHVRPEKLIALTQFFNSKIKKPGKKVLIMPGWLRISPEKCRGDVLKDVGMLAMDQE